LNLRLPSAGKVYTAENTPADIVALDYYDQQVETLTRNINKSNYADRIEIVKGNMNDLSFSKTKYDLIWSESSIYNIGFENGLNLWRDYLKDGGYIAVSEAVWLTDKPSKEIFDWWNEQYPGIKTVDEKSKAVEGCKYELVDHFLMPKSDWWEGYYDILSKRAHEYGKSKLSDEDRKIIQSAKEEIEMFERYSDQYGYAFFIMGK